VKRSNEDVALANAVDRLSDLVDRHREVDIKSGVFAVAVHAAIAKAYDFLVWSLDKKAKSSKDFLSLATLRSICEDLIGLSFLAQYPKEVRDEVVTLIMMAEVSETAAAQRRFFGAYRGKKQLVYSRELSGREFADCRKRVTELIGMEPMRYGLLPSVNKMAQAVSLSELYQFLYHGTSRFVHFSPRFKFSAKNFQDYYREFGFFWGHWLLVLLVRLNVTAGLMEKVALEYADTIESALKEWVRWPELVTFEEMNIKPEERSLLGLAQKLRRGRGLLQWEIDLLENCFGQKGAR
jgi:hypothetical protein